MRPADLLSRHLGTWPGPAAAGLARPGQPPVLAGPADKVFAWASVTKLLVSMAVWVAVEEGTVSFEDPAGPPGSTLAHLLSHASGLPFEGPLAVARPAQRRTYSNTGIELAASHLAQAAGIAFAQYLAEAVLHPLGMHGTRLSGSAAHGATGPLTDLAALAGELLSPSLVSEATLRQATSVAWPGLSGVLPGFGRHDPCDWGLGPEVRSHKTPHWTGTANSPATFGHFGQSGALLWVDPPAGAALVSVSGTAFGPWAKRAWPALSDAVLAELSPHRPLGWWAPGSTGNQGG